MDDLVRTHSIQMEGTNRLFIQSGPLAMDWSSPSFKVEVFEDFAVETFPKEGEFSSAFQAYLYLKARAFEAFKVCELLLKIKSYETWRLKAAQVFLEDNFFTQDFPFDKEMLLYDICKSKFSVPFYKEKLLSTGDLELIFVNEKNGDTGLGLSSFDGQSYNQLKNKDFSKEENLLGKVLMQIRKELA